jgi:hypothetical protein
VGNGKESWLATSVVGPGRLSFYWRVSSEAVYDVLEFAVGDTAKTISGDVDWQLQVANVPPGPQTLLWRYVRDKDTSTALDTAWLSDVVFAPGIWLEVAGTPTNGQCRLILYGIPGTPYTVLASANPAATNWVRLDPLVTATNFAMQFTDANANSASRFYRFVDSTLWFEMPVRSPDGQVQIILHNPSSLPFEMQVSSNLAHWSALAATSTVLTATNTCVLTEPVATNASVRFYRAVRLP